MTDKYFHDVPFEAHFASELPDFHMVSSMPGVDGFTLKVDALYKVSVVRIEVEHQFTLKVTKRRMTSSLQWQFLFIAFLLAGLFIVVKLTIVQPLSPVELLVTPWTAACKASLSFTISQSSPKIMSIDLVMPSNHLILCCTLLLSSVFPSIGVLTSLVAQTGKNQPAIQEAWIRSLGWEDPLEKGMATHSGFLAWKIPRTEEPGRL